MNLLTFALFFIPIFPLPHVNCLRKKPAGFKYNYNYLDRHDKLVKLALSDLKIVASLKKARERLLQEGWKVKIPREIDEYIEDFNRGHSNVGGWGKKAAEKIAGNPISTYRLLWRYMHKLPRISQLKLGPTFEKWIKGRVEGKKTRMPNSKDLEVAALGIFKIQQFYDIPAREFSRGNFSKVIVPSELDFDHIFEIGKAATRLSYSALAMDWWELAMEKSRGHNPKLGHTEKIRHFIRLTRITNDAHLEKGDPRNPWIFDHAINTDEGPEDYPGKLSKNRKRRRDTLFSKYRGSRQFHHVDVNLWGICNGENYQTREEKQKLFCWYEHKVHPKFTIGPLKSEFLHRKPEVLMIYDFIGETSIENVIRGAKRKGWQPLTPTTGQTPDDDGTGAGTYIEVWDGVANVDGLTTAQNLGHVTGLHTVEPQDAPGLYVKSYTWATGSEPHVDKIYVLNALHYLSEVGLGGRTAFPRLGFAVQPEKGALLLWFSQVSSGQKSEGTLHYSCPVILGHKVIATKWARPGPQFLTRFKCGLHPDSHFEILVNGQKRDF